MPATMNYFITCVKGIIPLYKSHQVVLTDYLPCHLDLDGRLACQQLRDQGRYTCSLHTAQRTQSRKHTLLLLRSPPHLLASLEASQLGPWCNRGDQKSAPRVPPHSKTFANIS